MLRMKRSGLVFGILFCVGLVVVVSMAGDVVLQPNQLMVGDLELKDNGDNVHIKVTTPSSGQLSFRTAYSEAFFLSYGETYFNNDVEMQDDLTVEDNLVVYDVLVVGDGVNFQDDLVVFGKMTSNGGYDPPYVLYDPQSRD